MDFGTLLGTKSFDALRQEAFSSLASPATKVTNLNTGGVFRTLLEIALKGLSGLYSLLVEMVPQGYVQYAVGQWLDLKAEEFGLSRQLATRAEGHVSFVRTGTSGFTLIPAGSVVKTGLQASGKELRFLTQADAILANGSSEVSVPVTAEFAGSAYNVGTGAIQYLVTAVSGIKQVTNRPDWLATEGTDSETDDSLRERCRQRWSEIGTGTKEAYAAWARSVAGVSDVGVLEWLRGPASVDVVLWSVAGVPTQSLVDAVHAYVDARRPGGVDVLVRAPVTIPAAIDVRISVLRDTPNSENIRNDVVRRLTALFDGSDPSIDRLAISQVLDCALLTTIARSTPGVARATLVAPAADVMVSSGQIAILSSLAVSMELIDA